MIFLYIADIKQLESPKVLAKIELENISDVLLSYDENRLFLNDKNQLSIFDISDKSKPKKLGSISSKPYYRGMVLSPDENSLYIVKNYGNKKHSHFAQIDIMDPMHIVEKKSFSSKDNFWNPAIKGAKVYISNNGLTMLDLNTLELKDIKVPFESFRMTLFDKYILLHDGWEEIALLKDRNGVIEQVNHLDYQAAWHNFYKRIRDIEFTPNGKYLAFIVNKNAISFKRFEVMLPMVNKDSLYDKDDYFGNYYSSIVQPNIDEIKEIILSKDGTKLFAFSSSDMFVYDISKLR